MAIDPMGIRPATALQYDQMISIASAESNHINLLVVAKFLAKAHQTQIWIER